jgi:hypothetical protein
LSSRNGLTPIVSLSDTEISLLQDAEGNHCSSFPTVLLQVMWRAAKLARPEQLPVGSNPDPGSLREQVSLLLSEAELFDAHAWATTLQPLSPASDLSPRTHVASAHRIAVCIYLSRLLLSLDPDTRLSNNLESLVSEAICHMANIRPCDALFTATTWPSFVTGAETDNLQNRAWTAQRFAELWEVEPWGTVRGALHVLRGIWLERDGAMVHGQNQRRESLHDRNWIARLRQTGVDWLII